VKFRYTLPALADLSAILDYIAAQSPQRAHRVQARIQAVAELLIQYPHIGRRTNDPAIRRMVTALIFYEATNTEIIIHAIRHAARNPSGMPGSA
jgi:toxin ParE1/3/4